MAKRGGRSGRKYVRDNRGRFATTGATARGGRLKTASGKKRAAQTVKAKTGGKPSGALKAKPRSEGQKYAGRVQAGKDLKRSQSVASQKKFLAKTQKRLDAAPLAQSKAAAKPTARSKPTAAAKRKSKKVSADKVSRIADRLNKVSTTTGARQGVKALNRAQVAVRAKRFLSRKAGGVSALNSSGASRADKIKSVQSSINTRIKYSTQKPNRNKPGRFNDLGQSSLRAKNKAAEKLATGGSLNRASNIRAQVKNTAEQNMPASTAKIKLSGPSRKAPDNARTRANRLKTTQAKVKYFRVEPDSSAFKSAVKQRDAALRARPAGTAGKVTFRSKARASSRFQQRANDVTGRVRMNMKYDRTKSLRATGGGGGKGARVRDTGASQTSLFGKPAPLRRASKVSVIKRRTGKRRFG